MGCGNSADAKVESAHTVAEGGSGVTAYEAKKLAVVHNAEEEVLKRMEKCSYERRDVMVPLDTRRRCNLCIDAGGIHCGKHAIKQTWPIHTVIVGADNADNIPIVLVHGFCFGAACFFKWLPMLAKERKVYAIDVIGQGGSGQPPFRAEHTTIEAAENLLVEPFERWAEVMGLERFILIGHSFGGFVCSAWAARDPKRIVSLGLLSPLLGFSDERLEGFQNSEATWQRRVFQSIFELAWEKHLTPQTLVRWIPRAKKFLTERVEKRFKPSEGVDEEEAALLAAYVIATMDTPASAEQAATVVFEPFLRQTQLDGKTIRNRLAELEMPIFSIYGDHDWMDRPTPEEIPKLHLLVLPNSGHHLYFDNVNELHRLVMDELRSIK